MVCGPFHITVARVVAQGTTITNGSYRSLAVVMVLQFVLFLFKLVLLLT